jgi:uncharacterized protein YndB with AHSA1/START domain
VTVSAPREQVFDFLDDLANRASFADHYMKDMRLTRPRSSGPGAAARFRLDLPGHRTWAETAIVDSERPRRIVEQGRLGRQGRSGSWTVWELTPEGPGATRVEVSAATEPSNRVDALRERFGARGWYGRQLAAALRRLRRVFEEEREQPLARVGVAGYEPLKSPRFGA